MELDPLLENSDNYESEEDTQEEAASLGIKGPVAKDMADGLSAFLQRTIFQIMFDLESVEAIQAIEGDDPELPQQKEYAQMVFEAAHVYETELKKCVGNLIGDIQSLFEARGNTHMQNIVRNLYKYKECRLMPPHISAKHEVLDPWTGIKHPNAKNAKGTSAFKGKCVGVVLEAASDEVESVQMVMHEDAAHVLRLFHDMLYVTHALRSAVADAINALEQKEGQTFDQVWIDLAGEKYAKKKASSWPQSNGTALVKAVARITLEMQTVQTFINAAD